MKSPSQSPTRRLRLPIVSILVMVAIFAPAWFDGWKAFALSLGAGLGAVVLFGVDLSRSLRDREDGSSAAPVSQSKSGKGLES